MVLMAAPAGRSATTEAMLTGCPVPHVPRDGPDRGAREPAFGYSRERPAMSSASSGRPAMLRFTAPSWRWK